MQIKYSKMRNTIAKAKILELIDHSEVALSHSEIEKMVAGQSYHIPCTGQINGRRTYTPLY